MMRGMGGDVKGNKEESLGTAQSGSLRESLTDSQQRSLRDPSVLPTRSLLMKQE